MLMLNESENLSLSKLNSIEQAIESNKHLDSKLDEIIKSNETINVSLAMKNLASVGKILNLAYAGSKGFKCSTSTIKILSKYQSMIHNSCLACSTFVSACLSSLKYHKCAISLAEKDKLKEALRMMGKCSESASKMVEASEELVNQADELCRLSEEALKAACEDENVSQQEKNRIVDFIKDSTAKVAELEGKTSSLSKRIEEIQEEKQKIDRKIDLNSNYEDKKRMYEKEKELMDFENKICRLEELSQTKKELLEEEKHLQKQERISNEEIAKIRTILEELTVEQLTLKDEDLKKSIKLLKLSKKELEKIKEIFESTRRFWIGVQNDCKELSDHSDLKDEVIEKLRSSGLQWLFLGKINYMAKETIEDVSKQADHLMNNLPTKSEAVRILQDEAENLRFILTSD